MAEAPKKKKKFNFKKFLILLLVLYLIGYSFYYLFSLPIKNILIKNTNRLSDYEIINSAKIKNYPSLFRTSTNTLKKRIKSLDLVKDVKITKGINGVLTIDIVENKILFVKKSDNVAILENGKVIANPTYLGVATLINYVPDEIYQGLIDGLAKIDNNVLKMISEIEYSEYVNAKNEVMDSERFLLKMNDDNTVYVNLTNIEKLNHYQEIISTVSGKGVLYLDIRNENTIFETYESMNKNE